MAKDRRKSLGREGEDMACKYLEREGYSIIERNFRTRSAEVDIVAEKDDVLYFIEVKTRLTDEFSEFYSEKQRTRLKELAEKYLADKKSDKQAGFALLAIMGNPLSSESRFELIPDNFNP